MTKPNFHHRAFRASDLDRVELLDDEKQLIYDHADFLEGLAQVKAERTFCGIGFIGDQPLFIGGYYEVAPGVCQVFIIPDKGIYERPLLFILKVRHWLRQVERKTWCHRIQTFSLPLKRIDEWMVALGFLYEGTLNRYTESGQDYKLWSRVKIDGVWRCAA